MTEPVTLLPPNATGLERATGAAVARISAVPVPTDTVWSANRCPEPLLPWLAWSLSVDTWDDSWPEATKRQVIAASFGIHQRKGTVGAVRRAIEALDFEILWLETGRQYGGGPHRFRVAIALDQRGLTSREAANIDAAIAAAKNVRSILDELRLYLQSRGATPAVGAACLSGDTATVYPWTVTEIESAGGVPVVAATIYGVDTITVYPGA